jgi:hypothetical protein
MQVLDSQKKPEGTYRKQNWGIEIAVVVEAWCFEKLASCIWLKLSCYDWLRLSHLLQG